MELDVAERLAGAVEAELGLGGTVGVVEGALGVRRRAMARRSSMVSADRRRRVVALHVGLLNLSMSASCAGRGNWRLTIVLSNLLGVVVEGVVTLDDSHRRLNRQDFEHGPAGSSRAMSTR